MVKGICKDCVFSEDLSEGMQEGESLWICWAKRKEYHEAPQVCAQFQAKEETGGKVEDSIIIPDDRPAAPIEPESAQPEPESLPPTPTPPQEEADSKPYRQELKAVESAPLTDEVLFGDQPVEAKEEKGELEFDDTMVGGKSPSFTSDKGDPKAGNVLSVSDGVSRKSSSRLIKIFVIALVAFSVVGGIYFVLFTPAGAEYDFLGLRAIIGAPSPSQPPPTVPAPAVPEVKEEVPATPVDIAQKEEDKEGEDTDAKGDGEKKKQEEVAKQPEGEKEEERKGSEETEAAAVKKEEEKAEKKEEPKQEKPKKKEFVGPVHNTPAYIIVDTISPNKEAIVAKYEGMKRKGYACGYLWIPDYPSLSGQKRWLLFVGPFDTLEEAKWRLEVYQKRVKQNAFGARLDLEPIQEKF